MVGFQVAYILHFFHKIEPLASKSEGALSVECDVMQVSSDSEESMDAPQSAPEPTLKNINKKYSEKNINEVHEMMPLLGPLKSKKLASQEVHNAKNLEEKIIPLHKETSDSVQGLLLEVGL